jgi:hypothetical protein
MFVNLSDMKEWNKNVKAYEMSFYIQSHVVVSFHIV